MTPVDIIGTILTRTSENLGSTEAVRAHARSVGAPVSTETRLTQAQVEAVRSAWQDCSQRIADPLIALRESLALAHVTPWGFGWDDELAVVASVLDKLQSRPGVRGDYVWDVYVRALETIIRAQIRQ